MILKIIPIIAILLSLLAAPAVERDIPGGPLVSNKEPGYPVRLVIPSIDVDADILHLGLAEDGSIGAPPTPSDVAWFNLGPKPGTPGSSIITGHFGPWRIGVGSVFDKLHKLKEGDKVYVKDGEGNLLSFTVQGSRTYNPQDPAPEIFHKEDDNSYLNLITCNGDWVESKKTYTERLVIFTIKDDF